MNLGEPWGRTGESKDEGERALPTYLPLLVQYCGKSRAMMDRSYREGRRGDSSASTGRTCRYLSYCVHFSARPQVISEDKNVLDVYGIVPKEKEIEYP